MRFVYVKDGQLIASVNTDDEKMHRECEHNVQTREENGETDGWYRGGEWTGPAHRVG